MPQAPRKKKDEHRGLKLMVLSLGIVLIGGTILLFVGIVQKMKREESAGAEVVVPKQYRQCQDGSIALNAGEMLDDYEFDGTIMKLVTLDMDGNTHIRLIDVCSGREINHVVLEGDMADFMLEESDYPLDEGET